MGYVNYRQSGPLDQKIIDKIKWLDGIPFMKNKVGPAIAAHVQSGGHDPALVAIRTIGKERAVIFAESHARALARFRQELESWVQRYLVQAFGEERVQTERNDDGKVIFHGLNAEAWQDLAGWVNSSSRTRLEKPSS